MIDRRDAAIRDAKETRSLLEAGNYEEIVRRTQERFPRVLAALRASELQEPQYDAHIQAWRRPDEDNMLCNLLCLSPALSLAGLAENMKWRNADGTPAKNRVRRRCETLVRCGLAWKNRNGQYRFRDTKRS